MNPWLIAGGVYLAVAVLTLVWLSRGLFRRPSNRPYNHEDEQ